MAHYKSSKLFNLEDRKRQTGKPTTEVDIFQWKSTLLEELRKNDQFTDHLKPTSAWQSPKVENRGFTGTDAEKKSKQVDDLLTKVASYSPSCLVRAISKRTSSLEDIWSLVRDWAGIQTTGSRHLDYYRVKRSWKPDGDETKQEFFYRLKDSMEDTLISSADNITEDGRQISEDEDMTPCLNSIVVMDWVDAIGGAPLVEHIHRVYGKDLETVTLGSLQSRISKNLDSLIHELEEQQQITHISRVVHSFPTSSRSPNLPPGPQRRFPTGPPKLSPFPPSPIRRPVQQSRKQLTTLSSPRSAPTKPRQVYCKLCASTDHFISSCSHLTQFDRTQIAKARLTSSNQPEELQTEDDTEDENHEYTEAEEEEVEYLLPHHD